MKGPTLILDRFGDDFEDDFNVSVISFYFENWRSYWHTYSSLLEWIQSYLQDRKQYVKIVDFKSREHEVHFVVFHKVVMGPILVILFVYYFPNIFKHSTCEMYAQTTSKAS